MLDGGHYKARGTSGIKRKFPWDELDVGETFTVENRTPSGFSGTLRYANESRAPKKFGTRTVGKNLVIRRVK